MLIPPGYMNVQVLGRTPAGRDFMTACGCVAESVGQATADDCWDGLVLSSFRTEVMSDQYAFTGVRLVVGTSDPSAPIVFEHTGNVGGSITDDAAPSNCCALIRKKTILGGRKGRGRCFLPGLTDSAIDDQGRLAGDVGSDTEWGERFWDGYVLPAGADPVLFHADDTHAPSPITEFTVDSLIATQRRRLRP